MLRRIRTRSSENIVAELVHLHKAYGMQGFMFYDDELNVNKNMVELMQLIAKWKIREMKQLYIQSFV